MAGNRPTAQQVREARRRLVNHRRWLRNPQGSNPYVSEIKTRSPGDDMETLMAHIDALEAERNDALRLMQPFARFFKGERHDLSPAADATIVTTFLDDQKLPLAELFVSDFRAVETFVAKAERTTTGIE